jgi:hypothetical protein
VPATSGLFRGTSETFAANRRVPSNVFFISGAHPLARRLLCIGLVRMIQQLQRECKGKIEPV